MPSMFVLLVILAETAGLTALALVITWMAKYRKGFAFNKDTAEFDYHPVFMTLGFIFLNGNALITYRVIGKYFGRMSVKIIHMVFQLVSLTLACFALGCVFQFHNAQAIPNLYSIHSWMGLTTFVFFTLQFLFGFVAFLILGVFKKASTGTLRKAYLHIHVYGGVLIFIMAAAAALLGTLEIIFFDVGADHYPSLPPSAVIANVFAVTVVIFVATVCYILFNEGYKPVVSAPDSSYQEHLN